MSWHKDSVFHPGHRRPMDRPARRLWLARADSLRRLGHLTALHLEVGRSLLRRLSVEGRCDPGHERIAADAGCSARTVRTALARLRAVGLLDWMRRLQRDRWACRQASNSYLFSVPDGPLPAPRICGPGSGGKPCRGTRLNVIEEERWDLLVRAALARSQEQTGGTGMTCN